MSSPANFEAALEAALSHLMSKPLTEPDVRLAVGFSGGGDSTALLYALRHYTGRVHAFIVDHGLRDGSAAEALDAQKRAQNWGFKADVLIWQTALIHSALQAKARRARYGLIGEAMRARGLDYLVTGHTQDDQAETCLMRYDRGTDWRGAAGMSPRIYAPVWPQLAGITVLRPLLGQSRDALREYNRQCGLEWAEDPSNENRDFTRIRARDYLQTHPSQRRLLLDTALDMQNGRRQEWARLTAWLTDYAQVSPQGYIRIKAVPSNEGLRHLIRGVGGQGGMIDRAAIERLRRGMIDQNPKAWTLGGAHIIRKKNEFLCVRDPAIVKGRRGQAAAISPQSLNIGKHIWDGRFLIHNKTIDDLRVMPAWGHIEGLAKQFPFLKTLPPEARPTLPLLISGTDKVISLGAASRPDVEVKALQGERLLRSFL